MLWSLSQCREQKRYFWLPAALLLTWLILWVGGAGKSGTLITSSFSMSRRRRWPRKIIRESRAKWALPLRPAVPARPILLPAFAIVFLIQSRPFLLLAKLMLKNPFTISPDLLRYARWVFKKPIL